MPAALLGPAVVRGAAGHRVIQIVVAGQQLRHATVVRPAAQHLEQPLLQGRGLEHAAVEQHVRGQCRTGLGRVCGEERRQVARDRRVLFVGQADFAEARCRRDAAAGRSSCSGERNRPPAIA